LIDTWWFVTFKLFNSQFNFQGTWLRHYWCHCVYFWLPNITNPMYIQYLGEIVPPPRHITVGVCNQVTFLIFYYNSCRLVPLLEVVNAPIKVSDIVYLIVSFKFLNFSFQICLLFVPECLLASCLTLFILSILLWLGSSIHCILACFVWSNIPKHSSWNHGFCYFISCRPILSLAECGRPLSV
jgi:hypothetical protein